MIEIQNHLTHYQLINTLYSYHIITIKEYHKHTYVYLYVYIYVNTISILWFICTICDKQSHVCLTTLSSILAHWKQTFKYRPLNG